MEQTGTALRKERTGNKLYLRRKLFTVQLKEGQSIEQHITCLKEIAEELESIKAGVTEDDLVLIILGSRLSRDLQQPHYITRITR